jgi:hypothetical protein
MTKSAPQAMQAAIKRSRWRAWLSGQSGAKTISISSLLTSQSRPRLTDSAQNSNITREESQAAISRQQVTDITKMFDKKKKFSGEIGNGNVPLDNAISAYRLTCKDIVASNEDARRAMFTIFSDAALAYFYEHDTEWYSVSEVFAGLHGIFMTLLLSSNSRLSGQSTHSYMFCGPDQFSRVVMSTITVV